MFQSLVCKIFLKSTGSLYEEIVATRTKEHEFQLALKLADGSIGTIGEIHFILVTENSRSIGSHIMEEIGIAEACCQGLTAAE